MPTSHGSLLYKDRPPVDGGLDPRRPAARRRRGARRQDGGARVRHRRLHPHQGVGHDAQPVEPRAHAGRFERRLGRCGGRRPGAVRHRQRRRRLDPHPRRVHRPGRVQAELRAHPPPARRRRRRRRRLRRAHHHRGRRGPPPRRGRRPRRPRPPVAAARRGVSYEDAIEALDVAGLRAAWSPDLGFAAVDPEVAELTEAAAAAPGRRRRARAASTGPSQLTDPVRTWLSAGAVDLWLSPRGGHVARPRRRADGLRAHARYEADRGHAPCASFARRYALPPPARGGGGRGLRRRRRAAHADHRGARLPRRGPDADRDRRPRGRPGHGRAVHHAGQPVLEPGRVGAGRRSTARACPSACRSSAAATPTRSCCGWPASSSRPGPGRASHAGCGA